MTYYVYIVGNNRPTLYIGITNDLVRRIYEHKNKLVDGFSNKYDLDKLLYFEEYNSPIEAILREKQMKKWNRSWKLNLISNMNPGFEDLFPKII